MNPYEFIFYLGIFVLYFNHMQHLFRCLLHGVCMFATKVGVEIADRLYSHYLNQDWLFHTTESSF